MTVDFSANLQGLTSGVQALGQRMQYRAAVGKARNAFAIEQMRINARCLGRGIGAQTHAAPGQLVYQLQGTQIHVMTGSSHQRIEILQQRRHHQLVAMHAERVKQQPAQLLNTARLIRQHVGDVLRQCPARHPGLLIQQ